ncbi:low molecular weight phosphotyrosine protein phosphatase [Bacillaceae bacterium Marseille-Q3522]|nr:low molecular weight phosphotyrosine protein phosphatase [Bacillaceae bacterium Marseille-Q3522]
MIKVLFVCLGNICRSPMAEAMFRDIVKREGLEHSFKIDSAGIGSWHIGDPPHKGTQTILRKNQISFAGLTARQIGEEDLYNFDYIIAMDKENIRNIQRLLKNQQHGKITQLLDFVPGKKGMDVPDPYYSGNFEEVYALVQEGCRNLYETIRKDHQLE